MSRSSSFAKASSLTVLLLLALALQQLEADMSMSCSGMLSDLSPCLGFLQGEEDYPSADCCDGASSLVAAAATTADRQEACECLKSAAGEGSAEATAARDLPADCGLSLPFTISPDVDCSQID
ncbi:non-specific lipid-transfer protein 4.1-like [Triticum urartu]|uniref:Non-specific lipid-transfer protein n=3 Tax=Triticum TaxID=4564 RepID=A0A9R0ZGC0_TRITD|nr:non-specific lipid-transfer protein 4.1-like [Triticum aestivum]XP_048546775.1 non-specific lipid-transfer protein 4.1-like [Triticum urartu]VAI77155.1 unnamed protein product [Triticum turgidum subsp. durum]